MLQKLSEVQVFEVEMRFFYIIFKLGIGDCMYYIKQKFDEGVVLGQEKISSFSGVYWKCCYQFLVEEEEEEEELEELELDEDLVVELVEVGVGIIVVFWLLILVFSCQFVLVGMFVFFFLVVVFLLFRVLVKFVVFIFVNCFVEMQEEWLKFLIFFEE